MISLNIHAVLHPKPFSRKVLKLACWRLDRLIMFLPLTKDDLYLAWQNTGFAQQYWIINMKLNSATEQLDDAVLIQ